MTFKLRVTHDGKYSRVTVFANGQHAGVLRFSPEECDVFIGMCLGFEVEDQRA